MNTESEPMDYLQFDTKIADALGRYLGHVYSAEAFAQSFFRLHNHIASTGGGVGRPSTQRWIDSYGEVTTFPSVVFADLEDFAGDYTNGPSPEYRRAADPHEFGEKELIRRIDQTWLPQIRSIYGPTFVRIVRPDADYVRRRYRLASDLIDAHRDYADGKTTVRTFIDDVYSFRRRRDTQDVHHYQFDAAIWDAGVLDSTVCGSTRKEPTYDSTAAARHRLGELLEQFPEVP